MFDMLSGGIGAGAKRCKSSWETTNGIREIQLKYNRIKMRKIPPHNKKKRRYPEERRKETKWGVPDEMDKNKCQILIWIARCRAAPTAQKEKKKKKRSERPIRNWLCAGQFLFLSSSFLCLRSPIIFPSIRQKNIRNSRVLSVSRAACRWVTKKKEKITKRKKEV